MSLLVNDVVPLKHINTEGIEHLFALRLKPFWGDEILYRFPPLSMTKMAVAKRRFGWVDTFSI